MKISNSPSIIILEKDPYTFNLIKNILNGSRNLKIYQSATLEQANQHLQTDHEIKYLICGYEIGNHEEEMIEPMVMSFLAQQRKDVKYIPYPYLKKSDLLISKNKILVLSRAELVSMLDQIC